MFKSTISIMILSLTAMLALEASAVAPRPKDPPQSEIKLKAKEVLTKEEKSYHCTLEGRAENWSLFTSNDVEVNVTAVSLQNAAELALTPYVISAPANGMDPVKISVEGQNYFVQTVNCKPIQQSI